MRMLLKKLVKLLKTLITKRYKDGGGCHGTSGCCASDWAERMHKEGDWGNGGHQSKGDLLRFYVHILGVDMRVLYCSLMLTDPFMCY